MSLTHKRTVNAPIAGPRARKAGLRSQGRSDSDPAVQAADRDLRTAKLEQYISRTLADAPPLNPDQLARLRNLLADAPAAGAA